MATEHSLEFDGGCSWLRAKCTCGEKFGRATGLNTAGENYARCAFCDQWVEHMRSHGLTTRPVRRKNARAGKAVEVSIGGRVLGVAMDRPYRYGCECGHGFTLGARGRRWYAGGYASMGYTIYRLIEKARRGDG